MRDERGNPGSGAGWRKYRLPPLISCLPLLWLATPAIAATGDKQKWYQVEVIVFQQRDHYQQEQPRRDLILEYPGKHLELIDPNPPVDSEMPEETQPQPEMRFIEAEPATDMEIEQPFEILDESQRQMNTHATTLRRRSGYRVLYHQAWRQPGISSRRAPWVLVRSGDRYGEHFELEGSLRVVLDNYLHLETNLWMSKFEQNLGQEVEIWPPLPEYPIIKAELDMLSPQPAEDPASGDFAPPLPNTDEFILPEQTISGIEDLESKPDYLVTDIWGFNANRKLKLNEIHYLDHPNLGVLVRVVRYELPELEDSEIDSSKPN